MSEHSPSGSPPRARLELGGIVLLLGAWAAGLHRLAGPPDAGKLPAWPGWGQLELLARSQSAPVDGLVQLSVLGLWLVWSVLVAWLGASLVLELLVVLTEWGPEREAAWVRRLQAIARDLAFPLVRPAVATLFAAQLAARTPTPGLADNLDPPPVAAPGPADGAGADARERDTAPAPERVIWHTVQRDEAPWSIARRYYGSGDEYPRIMAANVGRQMGKSEVFTLASVLKRGWLIKVPLPATNIQERDGVRYYVVQPHDTMSGISARVLGDENRWPEIAALNVGVARLGGDGPVLTDPDVIWTDTLLELPATETGAAEPAAEEPAEPAAAGQDATPAAPAPSLENVSPPCANGTSAGSANGVAAAPTPKAATPAPTPPLPETAVRTAPDEPAVARWPEMPAPQVVVGAAGAAVLGAAVLRGLRARRRPVSRPRPESDTLVDVEQCTVAEPAAVRAARGSSGDDPHGIVLGERLAQTLLQRAAWAELAGIEVVSVVVGRSGATATFAAPLARRALLETVLRSATDLAAHAEVRRSPDQDVVVHLAGVRQERLGSPAAADAPLLLCLGLRPDSRALLVGWRALGHLVVAARPGALEAPEHLAALVATLAGQCAPTELRLFTLASPAGPLEQLAPLPHQERVVDPADRAAASEVLAALRAEVERRQGEGMAETDPELVLVVDELAAVAAEPEPDLSFLLAYGEGCRVRVVAAVTDPATAGGPLVEAFPSRSALRLDDEATSVRLLGSPAALALVEDGRLLARLQGRAPIEVLGLHLTDAGRQRLFEDLGIADGPPPAAPPSAATPTGEDAPSPVPQAPEAVGAGTATVAAARPAMDEHGLPEGDAPLETAGMAEVAEAGAGAHSAEPEAVEPVDVASGGDHAVAEQPPDTPTPAPLAAEPEEARAEDRAACPERLLPILRRAPLALDCGTDAAIWTARGRLPLEQDTLLELLARLGAGPLLSQKPLLAGRPEERWPGVSLGEILDEVWAPWARNPDNREGGQAWVRMRLSRLPPPLGRVLAEHNEPLVKEHSGYLRLNDAVLVSDVEAFMLAVERARAARGAEQVAAAEEALALRVPGLLPDTPRLFRAPGGRRLAVYGWLEEPHWERAAARLGALWREAALLLARAYRGVGRPDAALAVAAEVLGEDPLDQAAHEALLLAAAQTGDLLQLRQAWQQVQACSDGDVHPDVRALYERLVRERSVSTR